MSDPASIVTYLDYGPSYAQTARQALLAWATSRLSEGGASEVTLLGEVGRPERLALVETWADPAQLQARDAPEVRLGLNVKAGLAAPPDERVGEPFSIGAAGVEGSGAVHVLIHIDVIPFNLAAVGEWLTAHADAARGSPGALRYDVWRQVGRPNHFTAIQAWTDEGAYARHIESEGARAFRENVMTVKGALYDERLYGRFA
jgi:quinol monooxygenase YgiN